MKKILLTLGILFISLISSFSSFAQCYEVAWFTFEGAGYNSPHEYVYMTDDGAANLTAKATTVYETDAAYHWRLIPTGDVTADGKTVYYLQNDQTLRYIYREATQLTNGNYDWEYYRVGYNAINAMTGAYKWVVDDNAGRIIAYDTYTVPFNDVTNFWIHSNNWAECPGCYQAADQKPGLICGRAQGNSGRFCTIYKEKIFPGIIVGEEDLTTTPKEETTLPPPSTEFCAGSDLILTGKSANVDKKWGWKKSSTNNASSATWVTGYELSSDASKKILDIKAQNSTSAPVDEYYFFVVENNCGDEKISASQQVTINPTPIITSVSAICEGDDVTLSVTNGGTIWNSRNISVATVNAAGKVTAVAAGKSYIINTNTYGCSDSTEVTVKVCTDLALDKTSSGNTCMDETITFTLTLSNNSASVATGVKVTDIIPSYFTYTSASSMAYDPLTGIWNAGNLAIGEKKSLEIKVNASQAGADLLNQSYVSEVNSVTYGSYALAAIKSEVKTTVYSRPAFTANSDFTMCKGAVLQLNANITSANGGSYLWTGPNGFTSTSADPVVANSATSTHQGTYKIVVTDAVTGCKDSTSFNVTISSCTDMDLHISSNTPVCQDENVEVSITITNNSTYTAIGAEVVNLAGNSLKYLSVSPGKGIYNPVSNVWQVGNMIAGETATLKIIMENTAGHIPVLFRSYVSEVDGDTYTSYDVAAIKHEETMTFHPLPQIKEIVTIDLKAVRIIVEGGTPIYQYAVDNTSYIPQLNEWKDLDYGNHIAYVKDANGCKTEKQFMVRGLPLVFPPMFTPNNDGVNDKWIIGNLEQYQDIELIIFDRFGKELVKITDTAVSWDGKYNGKKMNSTDYWYILNINDTNEKHTGHFTLKR